LQHTGTVDFIVAVTTVYEEIFLQTFRRPIGLTTLWSNSKYNYTSLQLISLSYKRA